MTTGPETRRGGAIAHGIGPDRDQRRGDDHGERHERAREHRGAPRLRHRVAQREEGSRDGADVQPGGPNDATEHGLQELPNDEDGEKQQVAAA